jgi:NADP-dependent 3-hydroxy acid dehydrogenase YdfG
VTAHHLATNGAKVFLGARRKERLDTIVAEPPPASKSSTG